jgi:site-specific recombinase XerD
MPYAPRKGLSGPKVEKTNRQKFLTLDQVRKVLATIEEQNQTKWRRDHCAVYLGFFFGLRVAEAVILERACFRSIDDEVYIRTKKQSPRIKVNCECGRRWSAAVRRIGTEMPCPNCVKPTLVRGDKNKYDMNPPERIPTVVESRVKDYIKSYLENHMRPDQRWLLESHKEQHLSTRMLEQIFGHYVMASGLDPAYSFHSLRHGRGVLVYERFQDPVMLRDMLRQKSLAATEFYMHLSPAQQEKYLSVLDTIED